MISSPTITQRWVTNKSKQTKKLIEQHSYQRQKETIWAKEVLSIKHQPLKQQAFSDATWVWDAHDAGDMGCWGHVIRGVWCRVCVMLGVQIWGYVTLGVCDAGCMWCRVWRSKVCMIWDCMMLGIRDAECVWCRVCVMLGGSCEVMWCWLCVMQGVCDAGCMWFWVYVMQGVCDAGCEWCWVCRYEVCQVWGVYDAGCVWWLACNYRTPKAHMGFPRARGLAKLATMTNSVLKRETLPKWRRWGTIQKDSYFNLRLPHALGQPCSHTCTYTCTHLHIHTHIHGKVKEQSMLTVCQNQKITIALLTP